MHAYISILLLSILSISLPVKAGEVEAKSPVQFSTAATPTQTWEARLKRDRDETCSDRGCGRYLKERGSGRIERHKERGSGRISPKSAQTYSSSPIAEITRMSAEKCHRGSGRCNVKFMEPVAVENPSIA